MFRNKPAKFSLALIAVGILLSGSVLMAGLKKDVDVWTGTGTGTVTYNKQTYNPWASWEIHDYYPYASGTDNIIADSSGWTEASGAYGGITGEVNVFTYAASGEWVMDYPLTNPPGAVHGTWSGTFNRSTGNASGIWYYYNEFGILTYGGTFSGTYQYSYKISL